MVRPAPARAQIIAYDDTTAAIANYFPNGAAGTIGPNTTTELVADDIAVAPAFVGATISKVTFQVVNGNSAAVTVRPRLRMYLSNGANTGPGTLIEAYDLAPVTISAQIGMVVNYSPPAGFAIPVAAQGGINFWAGITFDNNNGTTGITTAQLDQIAQPVIGPPAVGSSRDEFFYSSFADPFNSNNPVGGVVTFSGSPHPPGDFYWQFQVAAVPEPGSLALCGLAVCGMAGWWRRRRAG